MKKQEVLKVTLLAVATGLFSYFVLTGFADYFEFYPLHIFGLYFLIKFFYVASHGLFCLMGEMDGDSFHKRACFILNIK